MYIYFFSVLVLFESLFACGMGQEKIPLTEANLSASPNASVQQGTEQAGKAASNIIFQSNDQGQTWTDVSAGLPESLKVGRVYADGGELVMSSGSKLYRSSTKTNALSWKIETLQTIDALQNLEITNLFPGKTGLFVSSYENGFFKEMPGAHTWFPIDRALADKTVRCVMEISDGTLFVGVESGLFKSVDGGASWKQVIADMGINSLVVANAAETALVCGTYEGLRRSTDGGEHWELVLTEDFGAWNIRHIEGGVVAITEGGSWKNGDRANRLRLSTDNGKTWQRIDEGLAQVPFMFQSDESNPSTQRIYGIEQLGKYLFCSTNAGIFRSDNMGKSWELVRVSDGKEMLQLAVSGNVIYAIQVVGC